MSTNYVQSPTKNICQCTESGVMCGAYAGHAFDNGQYCVWLCRECWQHKHTCPGKAAVEHRAKREVQP